jgi:hypothetical protein
VPDQTNSEAATGADMSRAMDFGGPDRNPDLGDLLWWYRKGTPRPGSRLARPLAGELPPRPARDRDDDDGDIETARRRLAARLRGLE